MINKSKLIFKTLDEMLVKKISADKTNTTYRTGSLDAEVQLGEPDIRWQSVVYIIGSSMIWTHGEVMAMGASLVKSVSDDFDVSDQGQLSLYSPMAISSFAGGGTYEKGSSVKNPKLTWSLNKTPKTMTLDGTAIDVTLREKTMSATYSSNKTFTLKCTDARGKEASATTSMYFRLRKYYGVSEKSVLSNADVLALANKVLATSCATSKATYDCTGGKFFWFCYPKSWTAPKFNIGGLSNSDFVITEMQLTNASGHTEAYKLYRTTNIQTGKPEITIS